MATNAIEKVRLKEPTGTNNTAIVSKPAQKTEELSELLAGNNSSIQEKTPTTDENKKGGFSAFGVLGLLNFGFMIFSFTPFGKRFTNKIASNIFSKTQKSEYIKRMKNVLKSRATFQEIPFQRSDSAKNIVKMAKKLGIKISARNIKSAEDIEKYNTILSLLTDVHNKSKGRIIMPKKISLENLVDCAGEANGLGYIKLNRKTATEYLEYNTCHELGHINHFKRTNVQMLGTPKEVHRNGLDPSKAEEFAKNSKLKKDIEQNISLYATTEPAEFVAETFALMLGGVPIPKHLLQRYAQYKGMTRLPAIRDFSQIKNPECDFWDYLDVLQKKINSGNVSAVSLKELLG